MRALAFLVDPLERTRFMRFAVVGAVGAVVDFGTFNLLSGIFRLPEVIAQSISFIVAVISNFTWNRLWTYPDSRSKSLRRQLAQFFIVNVIGLAIRTPIFASLDGPLVRLAGYVHQLLPGLKFLSVEFLGHNAALAVAIIVVMMWNFFVNRYWTFSDVH